MPDVDKVPPTSSWPKELRFYRLSGIFTRGIALRGDGIPGSVCAQAYRHPTAPRAPRQGISVLAILDFSPLLTCSFRTSSRRSCRGNVSSCGSSMIIPTNVCDLHSLLSSDDRAQNTITLATKGFGGGLN